MIFWFGFVAIAILAIWVPWLKPGAVVNVAVFVRVGVDVDDRDVADAAGLREERPEEYGVVAFVIRLGELVGVDALH